MTKNPDLTFREEGLFVSFLAETPEGGKAWRELVDQVGSHKVVVIQANAVIGAMRAAGYVVHKAKPVSKARGFTSSDDALLRELGA